MEAVSYNHGEIPGPTVPGRADGALFLHTSLCTAISLVSVRISKTKFLARSLLMLRLSGECAGHFRHILNKFPPQVSSRSSAAAWACHVHNEVNKSLEKELFDCSNIGDFYDCGCAEEIEKKDHKAINTDRIDLQVEKLG